MPEEAIRTDRSTPWQHHIDSWKTSGLSRAKFCRENDLNYSVFNYWHAKLIEPDSPTPKKIVPVVVSNSVQGIASDGLEIRLPNGVHIRGIDKVSVQLVGELIAQL